MRIAEILKAELAEPRTVFVFPTEVAARFWLRRAFGFTSGRTLRTDRFLSWDQFARRALDYGGDRRPAGIAERTLFAAGLLEANRRRPLFRVLVPPAGEPLAFLPTLRDLLPCLHHLGELAGRWPASGKGKREDLRLLEREYRAYLQRAGLYEPAFEHPVLREDGRRYRLFYPEALEEFPAMGRTLAASSRVAILRLPPPGQVPPIRAFADSRQEIAWALSSIAELLDRGVEAGDIALSVGDLQTLEPHLRRQAELFEVPLGIRLRRPLVELPPCRLFGRIQACLDTGFSLTSLRDLLLDRSLPWRHEGLGGALLALGTEHRIVKNSPGADRWERCFRRARNLEPGAAARVGRLRAYYRGLRTTLQRIAGAPDFRRLKEELTALSKSLLDAASWRKEELAAWQFALDTLDDFAEARAEAGDLPATPFRLWLRVLGDTRYGPAIPEAGVNAYGYGVSAGIAPAHHFVIGASQAATRWVVKKLPTLASHEEAALGDIEHDLSDTRLSLYALSGGEVHFSYARRGFARSHLPPGFFVAARAVEEAGPATVAHPDALEEQAWLGHPSPEAPLLPLQQAGFRNALPTALAPKSLDLTRSPLPDPSLLAELLRGQRDEAGLLAVSPTALELFLQCPFRFLLEHVLHLSDEVRSPVAVEPLEFGNLMHRVFQVFHERVRRKEPGGRSAPERRETYRRWMAAIVRRVFQAWKEPTPVAPAWQAARRRAVQLAERFVSADLEELAGWRVHATEHRLRDPRPEAGVLLRGKIDRISEDSGGYLVVDYKKKRTPTRGEIFGEQPVSYQMPFYVALMRATGLEVRRAAYYSIEEARYLWVTGGRRSMADGPTMEQALRRLEQAIAGMAAALASGDFTVPRTCASCGRRGICRARFALTESHGPPLR